MKKWGYGVPTKPIGHCKINIETIKTEKSQKHFIAKFELLNVQFAMRAMPT
jgi:hypothetical protein